MRTAEKFGMPVVCLVDTPAAHAGVGAEERGQAWAIAQSLITMLELRVPVVSAVLSEGGSGGALALALADRVLALENAVYTVAPPETCAAILYRDAGQRARAAAAMRPGVDTAHLLGLVDELVPEPEPAGHPAPAWGLLDDLVPEPEPGAHAHPEMVVAALRGALTRHLEELCRLTPEELIAARARRHRPAPGEQLPPRAAPPATAPLVDVLFGRGASDLLLSAGAPPVLRVDGELTPASDQPLT